MSESRMFLILPSFDLNWEVKIPSSKNYKRDYKQERANYDSKPSVRKKNAARKRARRLLEKEGVVKKNDGKDVDHKNGNAKDNRRSNLSAVPRSKNRSYARTKTAGKKNKRS